MQESPLNEGHLASMVDAVHFVNAIKIYFWIRSQFVTDIINLAYSWFQLMLELVLVLKLRVIPGFFKSFQSNRIVLAPIF